MEQCKANTKKGTRCKKRAINDTQYCYSHQNKPPSDSSKSLSDGKEIGQKANSIALMNTLIAALALIFSIFGYKINQSLEKRNVIEWQVKQAKHRRELWGNLEKVEKNILNQVSGISLDISEYMRSYIELLNEIERMQRNNKKISLYSLDMKLNAAYASVLGDYAKLESSLAKVTVEYHNSILLNSPLVKVLSINCWELYMSEGENFKLWKLEVIEPYKKSFSYVQKIINTSNIPEEIEQDIIDMGNKMGTGLTNVSPPSLKGLWDMKMSNYPNPDGSLKSLPIECRAI